MNAVKIYMTKFWNFVTLRDMYYKNKGYFILRFKSAQDHDVVMSSGLIRSIT